MTRTRDVDPVIEPLSDTPGIHIFDPIEAAQFTLFTLDPVEFEPADPLAFFFPVDRAVQFETDALIIPKLLTLHLRAADGEFLSTFDPSQGSQVVEAGAEIIQLSTAPMTLYLELDHPMTIRRKEQTVVLTFDQPVPLRLGVRSFHESPAATIQVTDDPADVMAAISYFGSALQTMSPERSFGTLRGHPPALERGDSLEIPDSLDRPDSPVTIELPPEFEYVYPAAPLAFYLGATVEPGPEPRLICGDIDRSLVGEDGFQQTVHDLLQHVFFMDCITRTEGFYKVDLHERNELEALLDEPLDFHRLYDASLETQVERYLDLPITDLQPIRPTWHLCTDVHPTADSIESLPYIVNELPLIRCPYTETAPPGGRIQVPTDSLDSPPHQEAQSDVETFVRKPDTWSPSVEADPPLPEDVFNPPGVPTIEHEWFGPGIPLVANKATPETYRRRHQREPVESDYITIDIVCNDPAMDGENVVEDYYGLRDLLTFDVTVHNQLSRTELTDVLASSTDLLHYIGHVDRHGFRCYDGPLDAKTVDEVGCRAFLLNACTSYNQGQALIDAGSDGGVVTISEIANSVATETGRTIARLLNSGFTLRSAMSVAHANHSTGQQYIVVGDGGIQLVQSESAIPHKITLQRVSNSDGCFEFDYYAYPSSSKYTPGTFTTLHIRGTEIHHLPFGYLDTFHLSVDELIKFLPMESVPVEFGDRLVWSEEFTFEELRSSSGAAVPRDGSPGLR